MTLQAKIEAETSEAEGVTSLDDTQISDEFRNARVIHSRIRCPQLIPERNKIGL